MFLSPTYINILSIYAFTNLDDISWGTKQDSTVETDLGAVIQNSQSQVDVEIVTEPADVNNIYEEALMNIRTKKPLNSPKTTTMSTAEQEQQAKDYYANVRTNVLLAWALSNALLLIAILAGGDNSQAGVFSNGGQVTRAKSYLIFILTFTALSNCIRFIGSTLYLLMRIITGEK